jgi:hypothetical protein
MDIITQSCMTIATGTRPAQPLGVNNMGSNCLNHAFQTAGLKPDMQWLDQPS